jgi:hypothetical protein
MANEIDLNENVTKRSLFDGVWFVWLENMLGLIVGAALLESVRFEAG